MVCSLQKKTNKQTKNHRIEENSPRAVVLISARPTTFQSNKAGRRLLTTGHGRWEGAGPHGFIYFFIHPSLRSFRKAPCFRCDKRGVLRQWFPKTFSFPEHSRMSFLKLQVKRAFEENNQQEKKSQVWMATFSVSLGERKKGGEDHGGPWQRLLINIQNQFQNSLSFPPQLKGLCFLASGNLSIKKKKKCQSPIGWLERYTTYPWQALNGVFWEVL